jgi:hypothetical protein
MAAWSVISRVGCSLVLLSKYLPHFFKEKTIAKASLWVVSQFLWDMVKVLLEYAMT